MRFLLIPLLALAAVVASAGEPIDRIVAVVNDGLVLQSELDRALDLSRHQLADRKIPLPPEDILRAQVLERLILTRVQTQRAQEAGIRVDDRELNEVLNNIASQNRLSLADFAKQVQKEGIDYTSLREQVREEVMINRLRAREVESRVLVTDQDIALFLANEGQDQTEYRVSHILVAVPDGAASDARVKARAKAEGLLKKLQGGADFAQTASTSSDGQQALQGGDLDWRTAGNLPELFASAVIKLKPGELSPILESASGFHILKLTDQRGGGAMKTITETHAAHILLAPNAVRNDEQTKLAIRQVYDRLKKGEDLGAIAKKMSDDTGSKQAGGDLGWQPAGVFAPEFEDALKNLKPGEYSTPFRTQFGWHIAKVIERRSRDATDETRKARARQAIQNRKSGEEYEMWLRRLRSEAYVEIRNPDGTVAKPAA